MNNRRFLRPGAVNKIFLVVIVSVFSTQSFAEQSIPSDIAGYMDKISAINLMDEDKQENPHKSLLAEIESHFSANNKTAEQLVVTAISRASYARTQGFSALGLMKDVRKELEQAIEIDPKAMNGYAQSFLGRLYALLPGWPVSYGSDKKAKRYIEESLAISGSSMENQYSYGMYWLQEKEYGMAKNYLQAAKKSAPLVDGENWLANLHKQIDEALAEVAEKSK